MRTLGCLLLLILSLMPYAIGQAPNPAASVERARMEQMDERLKGKDVIASEESLRPGKTYDFVTIKQKTIELNHLIQDVDGDVVNASKGVLSADMSKRLKRIEKLAKEIRQAFE
jgi:hypothetical protein